MMSRTKYRIGFFGRDSIERMEIAIVANLGAATKKSNRGNKISMDSNWIVHLVVSKHLFCEYFRMCKDCGIQQQQQQSQQGFCAHNFFIYFLP